MSVSTYVFLSRSKLPAWTLWAEAVKGSGFEMKMDRFHIVKQEGFVPCRYNGRAAGFEYYYGGVADAVANDDLDEKVLRKVGDRDVMITFVTHSSMHGLMSAVIAAAALTDLTDGLLWDEDSWVPGAKALAYARRLEKSARRDLAQE